MYENLERLHPGAREIADAEFRYSGAAPECSKNDKSVDEANIMAAALRSRGSHGPSGVNAKEFRRLCLNYNKSSNQLLKALAALATRLNTEHVDPVHITALTASRMIGIPKSQGGTRPIGIGGIIRRILCKAVIRNASDRLAEAGGAVNLALGQRGGVEAALRASLQMFDHPHSQCVLLVDADNAFNRLNRKTALYNVQYTCPEIATMWIN